MAEALFFCKKLKKGVDICVYEVYICIYTDAQSNIYTQK